MLLNDGDDGDDDGGGDDDDDCHYYHYCVSDEPFCPSAWPSGLVA